MIYHILLAFVVTFIITLVLGKIGIPMLKSLHAQQSIREEGPESHQAKAGTPTMGGAFMMVALTIGVAIFGMWLQVCCYSLHLVIVYSDSLMTL